MASRTYTYDGSLSGLFALLGRTLADGEAPARVERHPDLGGVAGTESGGDLFADRPLGDVAGPVIVTESSGGSRAAELALAAASEGARLDFIYAWMSELPVERDALSFALRVICSCWTAQEQGADAEEVWRAAESARSDRGDAAVRSTLAAAQKVLREVHRLQGLLRFSEGPDGRLIARCACDHAVLPALAEHFSARFGERYWAIIDERRRVALIRDSPSSPRLTPLEEAFPSLGGMRSASTAGDEWEELWRSYHRAVAIDSRTNPGLQRRLMPVRYWKYLTELQ